jgi:hypothetical protein
VLEIVLVDSGPHQNAQYGWQLGDSIGIFAAYPRDKRTPQEVVAAEIAGISKECAGRFFSGNEPKQVGTVTIVRIALTCTDIREPWLAKGTLVIGDDAMIIVDHFAPTSEDEIVSRADDLVAKNMERLYRYD